MALIDPAVVEAARVIARQVATSVASSTTPFATPGPSTTGTLSTSATVSSASPTDTVANGQPGSPNGNGNNNNNNNGNSSPLLFFVALGFGVVFTNLWIIVGVKYCFRYNARNRQMRLDENGEPINLENMPRPHRRRREKKLMTMEEVNEKFPMQKYKNWVASRAQEGLPTRGGVSVPPSRANSVRDAVGVIPALPSKERASEDQRPSTSPSANANEKKPEQDPQIGTGTSSTDTQLARTPSRPQTSSGNAPAVPAMNRASEDDEDVDDEHINAALPPECLTVAGDTCAICIDTLEDDDDVRGLTCGHAFHAVCLDPWLTSRRACCPLCKADYYTPKPRPPAAEPGDGSTAAAPANLNDARRLNLPRQPGQTWIGIRGHSRMMLPSRFVIANQGEEVQVVRTQSQTGRDNNRRRFGLFNRSRNNPQQQAAAATTTMTAATEAAPSQAPEVTNQPAQGSLSSMRSAFSALRMPGRGHPAAANTAATSGATADVTPSNLEAGVRPIETR